MVCFLGENRKRVAAVSGVAIGEDEVRLAITKQRQEVSRYAADYQQQSVAGHLRQFDKLTA